jgi:hypothetical protein
MKRHGGKLTFDGIQEMTYLDMALSGMLRGLVGNVIYKTSFKHLSVFKSESYDVTDK